MLVFFIHKSIGVNDAWKLLHHKAQGCPYLLSIIRLRFFYSICKVDIVKRTYCVHHDLQCLERCFSLFWELHSVTAISERYTRPCSVFRCSHNLSDSFLSHHSRLSNIRCFVICLNDGVPRCGSPQVWAIDLHVYQRRASRKWLHRTWLSS